MDDIIDLGNGLGYLYHGSQVQGPGKKSRVHGGGNTGQGGQWIRFNFEYPSSCIAFLLPWNGLNNKELNLLNCESGKSIRHPGKSQELKEQQL